MLPTRERCYELEEEEEEDYAVSLWVLLYYAVI